MKLELVEYIKDLRYIKRLEIDRIAELASISMEEVCDVLLRSE